jgi:hypothetical protein
MEKKKGRMLIIGTCNSRSAIAELYKHMQETQVALLAMRSASGKTVEVINRLSKAMNELPLPEMPVVMNIDYSALEVRTIKAMTPIVQEKHDGFRGHNYGNGFYDECKPISKKAFNGLMRITLTKKRSHKQKQTDKWCNKWDRKIKRKL